MFVGVCAFTGVDLFGVVSGIILQEDIGGDGPSSEADETSGRLPVAAPRSAPHPQDRTVLACISVPFDSRLLS